jgi:quinohemoprotein ethanol dehydrogenase
VTAGAGPAAVNGETMRQLDAPAQIGDWQSPGRGWDENHYSPLDQINDRNVQNLGLAWYDDLETFRGVQASPLVIDGVLYNESIYNVVTAYDGKTGRKLWTYDPKVGPEWARLACCGPRRAASRRGTASSTSARSTAADRDRRAATARRSGAARPSPRATNTRSPARRASMTARS